jgi:hypothetical protein
MPPKGWKKSTQPTAANGTNTPAKKSKPKDIKLSAKKLSSEIEVGLTGRPPTEPSVTSSREDLHTVEILLSCFVSNRLALSGTSVGEQVLYTLEGGIKNAVEHLDRLRAALPHGAPKEAVSEAPKMTRIAAPAAPIPTPAAPVQTQAPAPMAAFPPGGFPQPTQPTKAA